MPKIRSFLIKLFELSKDNEALIYFKESIEIKRALMEKDTLLAAISSWRYYYEKLSPKHRKNKKIAVFAINKYKEESSNWGIDEISKSIPKALLEDPEIQELLKPVQGSD